MPEQEPTPAQPVFNNQNQNQQANEEKNNPPKKTPKKEEKKPLPPQFVTPPDPKTPIGKMLRSLTEIKNNFVLPRKIKIWGPRIAVIVISLTLIIALLPFVNRFVGGILPSATPTPTPEATEEPTSYEPSPYANDEVVLSIEKKIEELEQDLRIVDFREDTLRLPSLDWNVKFE